MFLFHWAGSSGGQSEEKPLAVLRRMSYATFWPRRSIRIVKSLTDGDFTEAAEPFALFSQWFSEATASEPNDPNAMALATVDATGRQPQR